MPIKLWGDGLAHVTRGSSQNERAMQIGLNILGTALGYWRTRALRRVREGDDGMIKNLAFALTTLLFPCTIATNAHPHTTSIEKWNFPVDVSLEPSLFPYPSLHLLDT